MTIDEEALRRAFAELRARVDYLERAAGLFASDEEMTGPRGDPQVKFAPRSWRGANYVGRHYSDCEPDFLEALAEALTWSAEHPKAGREKYAAYDRTDARRARTWARRMRAGWKPPETATSSSSGGRPTGAGRPTGGGRPQSPGRPTRSRQEAPPADAPPPDPTPAPPPEPAPEQRAAAAPDSNGQPLQDEDDFDDLDDDPLGAGDDDWMNA